MGLATSLSIYVNVIFKMIIEVAFIASLNNNNLHYCYAVKITVSHRPNLRQWSDVCYTHHLGYISKRRKEQILNSRIKAK